MLDVIKFVSSLTLFKLNKLHCCICYIKLDLKPVLRNETFNVP